MWGRQPQSAAVRGRIRLQGLGRPVILASASSQGRHGCGNQQVETVLPLALQAIAYGARSHHGVRRIAYGSTLFLRARRFCPVPGSQAKNTSREQYQVYQFFLRRPEDENGCARGLSYMQWLRQFRVLDAEKKQVTKRNVAGPMKNMECGVAMQFPFELLDIFVGAWAATFLPDMLEFRLCPDTDKDECHYPPDLLHEKIRRASFDAAEGCKYLKAVLCLDRFQLYRKDPLVFHPNVGELLAMMETDLILRGLTADRIATFKARIHALTLLLCAFRDGR